MGAELRIRDALPADGALVFAFVRKLAAYEKLLHAVTAGEADLAAALFAANPKVFALILEAGGEPVGFALWFYTFSTFLGRHGIWVEDVFVEPAHRGKGYGTAAFRHLAGRAIAEGCGRMEWAVLDWNQPAIRFYAGIGAKPLHDWITQRLEGDALRALAGG